MTKIEKIKLIRNIVGLGLVFSYFYNYLLNGYLLHRGYPYNTFLPPPNWDFADFLFHTFITRNMSPYLETGLTLKSNFPPFIHLLIWPVTLLQPVVALIIFSALFTGFCGWIGWKHLKGDSPSQTILNTLAIIFASYPFIFTLVRGNYEIYAFVLAYFAVMTLPTWRSAVLIAMAASCKVFPGAFSLLLLDKRNYTKFIFAVLASLAFTLLAFIVLKGGAQANIDGFRHMMQVYNQRYVLDATGLSFNHSFFGVLLLMAGTSSRWMASLYFVAAIITGVAIIFLILREPVLWKKVVLVVIIMTLLPYVSGDYKLLHFFIPLFLFLDASPDRTDKIFCWFFGLILVPKAWFFFGNIDVSCSTIFNPLLICGLLFVIAKQHFNSLRETIRTHKTPNSTL